MMERIMKLTCTYFCLVLGLSALIACNDSSFKGSSDKVHPQVTRELLQSAYPDALMVATQGFKGEPQNESFEQGEWGALDIQVVIDDSGSMQEEQANLATKIAPLLSKVARADWQIAVVTTDPGEGCQRALIKKSDTDAAQRFADAINAGTQGTGIERPILQAVNGLKCGTSPWVRPGSTLVTLLVTDEDNCLIDNQQGYGCNGEPDADGSFLVDYLKSIREVGKDAKVYGIYWDPSQSQSQCPTALGQAVRLSQVVQATGGTAGSICDGDFSTTLTAISNDVAQILKYEFDLAHDPDQGTLKITVDGQNWTQFILDGRKVRFTAPPPFGSKVLVNYTFGQSGEMRNDFPLDKVPVPGTFQVTINGQNVDPSTYSWDDKTQRLVFNVAPPENAAIRIVYKEKTPLNDTFAVGQGADPKTIAVYVDDQPVQGVVYNAVACTVKITPAPAAGAKIRVVYKVLH